MDIAHETLVFERDFDVPPEAVFAAYTDPRRREVWSAPGPETVFVIDSAEVRTGGHETARCGSADALKWTMQVAYHVVVEDRLIAFTEELWEGETCLTLALITFELAPRGASGTHLTVTDQVTSFVGSGGIGGHGEGYPKALDNLTALFAPV